MLVYYDDCKQCEICTNCGAKHTPHLICENEDCGADVDILYCLDDTMLCHECIANILQDYSSLVIDDDGNEHEYYIVDDEEYTCVAEFEGCLECETLDDYK